MSDHNSPPRPDDNSPARRRTPNSPPSPTLPPPTSFTPPPRRSPNSPPNPTLPPPTSFTPPPRRPPPLMGIPGQSAFGRYNRPLRPHRMSWPISRALFRPQGPPPPPPAAALMPVTGRSSGSRSLRPLPPPLLPSRMTLKRSRESDEGSGSGSGAGGGDGGDGGGGIQCSVCGKEFATDKALFGHMRSHPGRGWKGAHPPPAFSAEEEFADIRSMAEAARQTLTAGKEEEEEGGSGRGGQQLPDLNHSPPPDSDEDGDPTSKSS